MKIILASQSPNRQKLLSKIGLHFETFSPNIQEEDFTDAKNPESSCLIVAKQKALKAQSLFPSKIIIACDQMVYFNNQIFGKAHNTKEAIQTLQTLQDQTHTLLTGLCMLWKDKEYSYLCKSKMTMRKLNTKQIQSYILKEQVLKCAGSYRVEALGISLFEKIETEDFNSIEGLPLIRIINQLSKWNYPLFDEPA